MSKKPQKSTREKIRTIMESLIHGHESTLDDVPEEDSRTFALLAIADALYTFTVDYEIVNGIYTGEAKSQEPKQ